MNNISTKNNIFSDALDKTVGKDVTLAKNEFQFIQKFFFPPAESRGLLGRVALGICSFPVSLLLCLTTLVYFLMNPIIFVDQAIGCYKEAALERKNRDTFFAPLTRGLDWNGKPTIDFDTFFGPDLVSKIENDFDDDDLNIFETT